jgi:hypothetical protein
MRQPDRPSELSRDRPRCRACGSASPTRPEHLSEMIDALISELGALENAQETRVNPAASTSGRERPLNQA